MALQIMAVSTQLMTVEGYKLSLPLAQKESGDISFGTYLVLTNQKTNTVQGHM